MNIQFFPFKSVKRLSFLLLVVLVSSLMLLLPSPAMVKASGTVGNGTAASCTEAALDTALVGGGLINFNCGTSPVTITLTHQKIISTDTTIDGGGLITLAGAGTERLFGVGSVAFTIQNLKLDKGIATGTSTGGAIYSQQNATLTISNSTISNSTKNAVYGDLNTHATITNSIFTGNSDQEALWVYGPITITNSTFSNNSGGAVVSTDAVIITNSIFTGNNGRNGALGGRGNFTVTNSVFTNNTGFSEAGAIRVNTLNLSNSIVSNNTGYTSGGVSAYYLTINNSFITNNHAVAKYGSTYGGGIVAENSYGGSTTITNSTISGNTAFGGGGGIFNNSPSPVTIVNSVISDNSVIGPTDGTDISGAGGGIANTSTGSISITNSTITNNSALLKGGGIFNSSKGTINITNSTIANNSTPGTGGGIFITDSFIAPVILKNTIVANNSGGNCNALPTDSGGNLQYPGNSCGNTIATNDPKLGPLQDNRGPTKTMALLPGSPAIDTAVAANCPATDQRGISRPQGAGCDIGAFEVYAGNPTLVVTNPDDNGQGTLPNSLSAALNQAVANPGIQTINFNVAGGLITVTGALPNVPSGLKLDAGSCTTGRITLNGATAPGGTVGLVLTGNVTLKGLTVTKFKGSQIKSNKSGDKLICVQAIG